MHLTKNGHPTSQNSQNVLKSWVLAARPKTWIAGISPVCIGTAMAGNISWFLFFFTLLFALLIQIGTNFANDYFDFVKGADTEERQGPKRAVQQGWISPLNMLLATGIVFGSAFIISIPLMIRAGAWSLAITLMAICFGTLYTGGPKPLGYLGLGELFVLIFFGPVATCGAYFLQTHTLSDPVLIASLAPGLLACSLLIANNLRDMETDKKVNKKTLVVRFGKLFGSLEYILAISLPVCIPLILVLFYESPVNLLGVFFLFPIAFHLSKKAFANEFTPLLQGSALLFFFYTLLFCLSYLKSGVES